MKRFLILLLLGISAVYPVSAKPAMQVSVGFDFFYSSLSPYGEWIHSDFGDAWRPMHVAHGWRPYLYGHWVWTDYGWYWASDEPFGWATFHYGRWQYDDYYGWIWIPDDTWGPSWVEWRYDDDYIGWAPLPPYASFSVNVGISFSHRWVAPVHYWNFIPCRYFTGTRIVDYVQPIERSRRIFGSTRLVSDIRMDDHRIVNRGVDVGFVERRTNSRINRIDVITRDNGQGDRMVREGGREQLEVYRPRIEGSTREMNREETQGMNRRSDQNRMYPNAEPTARDGGRSETQRGGQPNRTPQNSRSGRRLDATPAPQQNVQRDASRTYGQRQRDEYFERRQERERQVWQQQQERQSQRMQPRQEQRQTAPRVENPRTQNRQQPQFRERPQPTQRPPAASSRGGREDRRRR